MIVQLTGLGNMYLHLDGGVSKRALAEMCAAFAGRESVSDDFIDKLIQRLPMQLKSTTTITSQRLHRSVKAAMLHQ
jgi:hypothetical protein